MALTGIIRRVTVQKPEGDAPWPILIEWVAVDGTTHGNYSDSVDSPTDWSNVFEDAETTSTLDFDLP